MKKHLLSTFLICIFAFTLSAQNQKMPVDKTVSTGTLPNGLTYYVKSNSTPENKAMFRLIVKAGSILEDDDQQGLAHFCEHMCFNGTKNFPKDSLVRYFESIGMVFGGDLNAFTSFDETVYMIDVPLDNDTFTANGLQVLYDWASQNLDTDEDIEAERGVIHQEWQGGKGANSRMLNQWLPKLLKGSKYANRLPIGTMEVVDNCDPQLLRDFRRDWYRPDLQAVAVVGDFDQAEMTKQVIELFSKIPARENPRAKEKLEFAEQEEEIRVAIATDKEASYTQFQSIFIHPKGENGTFASYRDNIASSLYSTMFAARIAELMQDPTPPFLYAGASYGEFIGSFNAFTSMVVTIPGKFDLGVKTMAKEIERVSRFGFNKSELDRAKLEIKASYEKSYNERGSRQSASIAEEFQRNFLTGEAIPGIEFEYQIIDQLLKSITIEHINGLTEKWTDCQRHSMIITGPTGSDLDNLTEEKAISLMESVKDIELEPYVDNVVTEPLIAEAPAPGTITDEKEIKEIEAKEYTLSNGAKIIVKKTENKSDDISMKAFREGGLSIYGDDRTGSFAATIMDDSGIANYDLNQLTKMLAGKTVSVYPFISKYESGFSGSSSINDFETMMQLVNLYMTKPRMDEKALASFKTTKIAEIDTRSNSPETIFIDSLKMIINSNDILSKPFTKEEIKGVKLSHLTDIVKEQFSDISDFTFVFVGNFDEAKHLPLINSYIGSLKPADTELEPKTKGDLFPKEQIDKDINLGESDKSTTVMFLHNLITDSKQDEVNIEAASSILTARLLSKVREEMGAVYSIGAYPSFSHDFTNSATVVIQYGSAPERADEVKEVSLSIINDMIKKGVTEEEIKTAKEKALRQIETQEQNNNYWASEIKHGYKYSEGEFTYVTNYKNQISKIDSKSIKSVLKNILNKDTYVVLKHKPAKK